MTGLEYIRGYCVATDSGARRALDDVIAEECKATGETLHSGGEIESQRAVGVGSQPDSEPRGGES